MKKLKAILVRIMVVSTVAIGSATEPVIADNGLDVLIGIIEKASRSDKELELTKYFDVALARSFNKSLSDPNGSPDFPWWFPRPTYETYDKRTISRSATDVSVIIHRSQEGNTEEHTVEYVLRKTGNIWRIFDVKELPGYHDSPNEVESLRNWLGLR
jgi:hypothetical protein